MEAYFSSKLLDSPSLIWGRFEIYRGPQTKNSFRIGFLIVKNMFSFITQRRYLIQTLE